MKSRTAILGCPDVCIYHDEEDEHVIAEVGLPGIKKKDITLEAGDEGFCLKAKRDDVVYDSCYRFEDRIETKKIRADFDNGLLKLSVPIDRRQWQARRISLSGR